jgi:hypothetical protein
MMKLSFSRASASTLVRRRSLGYDYREKAIQLSTQNATSYRSTGQTNMQDVFPQLKHSYTNPRSSHTLEGKTEHRGKA